MRKKVTIGARDSGKTAPDRGQTLQASPMPSLPGPDARPGSPRPLSAEFALPTSHTPGTASTGHSSTGLPRGTPAAPPPHPARRRYLLSSREAALRQSSRQQKSGYWRQISRPTSSRSRCFSFSPTVRTQGTISLAGADAALPAEAEVAGTPVRLPRPRLAPPAGRTVAVSCSRPRPAPPVARARPPTEGRP